MIKNFMLCLMAALLLNSCTPRNNNALTKIQNLSGDSRCYPCESPQGYEAKIKGLIYLSDIGIECCPNKRTLDSSAALKKVYLHRFYDLEEEQKTISIDKKTYYLDTKFNVIFYDYLKQELKARDIVVVDNNKNNSPYVTKVDLSFISFKANKDSLGLHSRLSGVLTLKDINLNKKITLHTRQDVEGFSDLKDLSFYNHLLIKQMANKVASIISELWNVLIVKVLLS